MEEVQQKLDLEILPFDNRITQAKQERDAKRRSFSFGFFSLIFNGDQSAVSVPPEDLSLSFLQIRSNLPYSLNCPRDYLERPVRNTWDPSFRFADSLTASIHRRRGRDTDALL
jgi:hypothetical protein